MLQIILMEVMMEVDSVQHSYIVFNNYIVREFSISFQIVFNISFQIVFNSFLTVFYQFQQFSMDSLLMEVMIEVDSFQHS